MAGIRVGVWTLVFVAACEGGSRLTAAGVGAELTTRGWAQAPLIPAYTSPVMATINNRLQLFGSSNEVERSGTLDSWEWRGGAWSRLQPVAAPGDRLSPGLARYGDTLLMFGGFTNTDTYYDGLSNESWQWRGYAWKQLSLPTYPPGRQSPALATLGSSVIMFGGVDAQGRRNDTWLYTWRDWEQQLMAAGPSDCDSPIATLGSSALLFCGGHTWLWDGARWSEKLTATRPSARYSHLLATYHDRIVMYGGSDDFRSYQETWEWDGDDWHDRSVSPSPPVRDGSQLMQQDDQLVLFSAGDSTTWTWNGESWSIAAPATMPPWRENYSIATLGDRVIMFGGFALGAQQEWLNDTWVWDGTRWTELQVERRPPPRAASRMAPMGDKLVLFGGLGPDGLLLDDTWELAGMTWTQRTPSLHPSARQHHAMAEYMGKVFLFGGASTEPPRPERFFTFSDMWRWDGSRWLQIDQPEDVRPEPSYQSAMARMGDQLALFEADGSRLWYWHGAWSIASDDWALSPLVSTPIYMVALPVQSGGETHTHLVVAGTSFKQFVSREWDSQRWTNASWLQLENLGPIAARGGSLVSLAGRPLRTWTYTTH